MLRSISGRQFREWRAYAELEPFDEERADLRTAHIIQTVLAVTGNKRTLTECLLPFGQEEPPAPTVKDWRAIKAAGDAWADALKDRHPMPEAEATPPPPPIPRRRRRTTVNG